MKKFIQALLSLGIVFLVISPTLVKGATNEERERYLLAFNTNVDYQLISNFDGEVVKEYQYSPVILVELSPNSAKKISKDESVLYIEADENISVATISTINMETQTIPWNFGKINAPYAHQEGYKGEGIKIGVIDTGIDYTHNDLNVVGGVNFVKDSIDYIDEHGHGTSVAGVIAALDNSEGIVGVAPKAELYAIKALDSSGNGLISDVVLGIEWAINNEIDIVNLSLTTDIDSKTLSKAIKEAYKNGILLVGAAGNKGFNSKSSITYPGVYSEVITVGATDINNLRAPFSSVGNKLELMAPGMPIYTTTLNGQYRTSYGTSLASPHVAGVAALIWGANQDLNNKEVRKILNKTAINIGDKYLFGNGLVDAYKVINYFNN